MSSTELNDVYDIGMYDRLLTEFYGGSGFYNFGYWRATTRDQREACENLMEELLSLLPKREGSILDVACGMGATTRHLLKYFPAGAITGINISEKQLATCRQNAPGVTFLHMDATRLQFADRSLDTVICVEAAFHFQTRKDFIREAWRVLKPGGRLILSDIRFSRTRRHVALVNPDNHFLSRRLYRKLYETAGFGDVVVVDATDQTIGGHGRHLEEFIGSKVLADPGEQRALHRAERWLETLRRLVRSYYLVSAAKPPLSA